jgi:aminoglycoside phosphotransferase (APT) family kinase protein
VSATPPPAEGVRLPYEHLPARVRAWVEDVLGEGVGEAVTQPGGFTPGVAARVVGVNGRRAFVKAVSTETNVDSPGMHRQEARVTAALPAAAPAPRLLASYDDGTWVGLVLEDIEGRQPRLPWRVEDLTRVVAALDELFDDLTPCPLADAAEVGEAWRPQFTQWRDAAATGAPPTGLDPWAVRHLDRLAGLEGQWEEAARGDTLLHLDLRADNMLIGEDRVWLVDWPWAARGNPAFDLLGFCPSVAMQGGPPPAETFAMSAYGRRADPEVVRVLVATIAGYFAVTALMPPPPGLPTVRAFQAAQGEVALRWLAELTGW